MYKQELRRISPEQAGISSARIQKLISDLEKETEMHGIMIARGTDVIAESWWAPYTSTSCTLWARPT